MGDDSKNLSAFPVIPPSDNAVGFPYPESGMTLRDYFVAQAMQGMITDHGLNRNLQYLAPKPP